MLGLSQNPKKWPTVEAGRTLLLPRGKERGERTLPGQKILQALTNESNYGIIKIRKFEKREKRIFKKEYCQPIQTEEV